MTKKTLHRQNVVACIWDFDKTLIPGYMQAPIFEAYGIDEEAFWKEVNALPEIYAQRGTRVSHDTIYLNHLISFVKNGELKGLTNARLRELGKELVFYPGLPDLFEKLKTVASSRPEYRKHNITLEHYIISTGLAEMIRGSQIAPHVDGIFGSEFIEAPLPPHYSRQNELPLNMEFEISQVGTIVDNTIKTRYIFEINKGSNKNPSIDVNASMERADRRVPIDRMLYVADGPSDVPVFSVVKSNGGKAFAVFNPDSEAEFAQNDTLLHAGRIHAYGPADYTERSTTAKWLRMHIRQICDTIVAESEAALSAQVGKAPRHLHEDDEPENDEAASTSAQKELFETS
ncbi:haloacid dehalogenase-like hydrolase [Coraliomargarita parva]|uniref:haloacid dehalogenase-like hydrolase n=1 Tax=Coraliomargarita parva TaxID=3014050 RepID=UPI0022B3BA46|nr:haloacid dehalogenase-like hydrolase [Coraliomargarita parva]